MVSLSTYTVVMWPLCGDQGTFTLDRLQCIAIALFEDSDSFRQVFESVDPDLDRFGDRCASDIYSLGVDCELNPPRLETFNAWGERIDKLGL